MYEEPLTTHQVRELLSKILQTGLLRYSRHAREEMKADGLDEAQIERALRGQVEPGEWENGSWRYRIHTFSVWVVIAFRGAETAVVITAWRRR